MSVTAVTARQHSRDLGAVYVSVRYSRDCPTTQSGLGGSVRYSRDCPTTARVGTCLDCQSTLESSCSVSQFVARSTLLELAGGVLPEVWGRPVCCGASSARDGAWTVFIISRSGVLSLVLEYYLWYWSTIFGFQTCFKLSCPFQCGHQLTLGY